MEQLKEQTNQWLKYIKMDRVISERIFAATETENPVMATASGSYIEDAKKAETPGRAPISVFDGLQTAVNLCRVNAGFDPLDPKGKGNEQHFLAFTNNIARVPFMDLASANTKEIKQNSRNADELINSFVAGFDGIRKQDEEEIKKSVTNLVKAALSYSNESERYSNFSQNLLQTDSGGDVSFYLYSSTFQIKSSNNKGVITYHSEYKLNQAQYKLSQTKWEQVKEIFIDTEKTTTKSWLDLMKTPVDKTSNIRAFCLE